jgi:charged multivesicular body protein 7
MSFTELLITRPNSSKARLPALYADFRPLKQNNPVGYESNIQAWQSALSVALKDGALTNNESILVLDVTSQLVSDLSAHPWGRPLGLGSVVVIPNPVEELRLG